jgi:hypothetical protein
MLASPRFLQFALTIAGAATMVLGPAGTRCERLKWSRLRVNEELVKALHGSLSSKRMGQLLQQYADTVWHSELCIGYARALAAEKRFDLALRVLDDIRPFEGDEQKSPWLRARWDPDRDGHAPPRRADEWFQDSYLEHYRRYPNDRKDVVNLLRAEISLAAGNVSGARKLALDLIGRHDDSEYLEEDGHLLRKLEKGVGDPTIPAFESLPNPAKRMWGAKEAEWTVFPFRSSLGRSLGMPDRIDRPWRDAQLVLAECFIREAKWGDAAGHLDIWLSKHALFYSHEQQIEASMTRLRCLEKVGESREAARERRRALKLCSRYESYVDRKNISYDVSSIVKSAELDPRKLQRDARIFIEDLRKKLM